MEQRIKAAVSQGQLGEALHLLQQWATAPVQQRTALQLQSRWQQLKQSEQLGTTTPDAIRAEQSRITAAILTLLDGETVHLPTSETHRIPGIYKWWGMVIGILGFGFLAYFLFLRTSTEPIDLRIELSAPLPNPNYPPLSGQQLKPQLRLDDGFHPGEVTADLVVVFNNIPASYRGQELSIRLYEPGQSRFNWVLTEDSVLAVDQLQRLSLQPSGQLGRIFGQVESENGSALAGVRVEWNQLWTQTDSNGFYELYMPPEQQQEKYPIKVSKAGFDIYRIDAYPGSPLNIELRPVQ